MIFRLMDEQCLIVVGEVDAEPICGFDFCDECGCCLACYNECPCCPQAVVYQDKLIRWMDEHGFFDNPFQ